MNESLLIKLALTAIIIGLPLLIFVSQELPEIEDIDKCDYQEAQKYNKYED